MKDKTKEIAKTITSLLKTVTITSEVSELEDNEPDNDHGAIIFYLNDHHGQPYEVSIMPIA